MPYDFIVDDVLEKLGEMRRRRKDAMTKAKTLHQLLDTDDVTATPDDVEMAMPLGGRRGRGAVLSIPDLGLLPAFQLRRDSTPDEDDEEENDENVEDNEVEENVNENNVDNVDEKDSSEFHQTEQTNDDCNEGGNDHRDTWG